MKCISWPDFFLYFLESQSEILKLLSPSVLVFYKPFYNENLSYEKKLSQKSLVNPSTVYNCRTLSGFSTCLIICFPSLALIHLELNLFLQAPSTRTSFFLDFLGFKFLRSFFTTFLISLHSSLDHYIYIYIYNGLDQCRPQSKKT